MVYVKDIDGNEGVAVISIGVWHMAVYVRTLKVWNIKFRYLSSQQQGE